MRDRFSAREVNIFYQEILLNIKMEFKGIAWCDFEFSQITFHNNWILKLPEIFPHCHMSMVLYCIHSRAGKRRALVCVLNWLRAEGSPNVHAAVLSKRFFGWRILFQMGSAASAISRLRALYKGKRLSDVRASVFAHCLGWVSRGGDDMCERARTCLSYYAGGLQKCTETTCYFMVELFFLLFYAQVKFSCIDFIFNVIIRYPS